MAFTVSQDEQSRNLKSLITSGDVGLTCLLINYIHGVLRNKVKLEGKCQEVAS